MEPNQKSPLREDESLKLMREISSRRTSMDDDGAESLWAISYSDLLMVMMSFFIVFFNLEEMEGKNANPLHEIIGKLHFDLSAYITDPKTGSALIAPPSESPKSKQLILKGFGEVKESNRYPAKACINNPELCSDKKVYNSFTLNLVPDNKDKTENQKETIGVVVNFSNDLFELGRFELNQKSKSEIDKVLKIIENKKDDFHLVLIGHADKVPLGVHHKRRIIKSNRILSSLRAAEAVEYIVAKGFDPHWVSSQGMGEFSRNTRSLSLRIMAR